MDFLEATSKVFDRIREVDPENVTKIIGYLLLQEHGDKEMIRLAFCPDKFVFDVIEKAKLDLQLAATSASTQVPLPPAPTSVGSHLIMPNHSMHFPSASFWHSLFRVPSQCWALPGIVSRNLSPEYVNYPDLVPEVANQSGHCFVLEDPELDGSRLACQRRRMCLPDFPVKKCHYFNSGYCGHGSKCKYLHEQFVRERYALAHEDHMFSPGSLEKLEIEIVEILKSRRGNPLSIASLPMIYYDKYGKVLQGDGYLTESQRHGKAGHSLTKLLSRLGSICLIDRPHGQHAVILAEDAVKNMESRNKDNPSQLNSNSRQIYLTFPAESTFTEEDVSDYFSNFGQVEYVRIPCQHKRMFGFVTFYNSDTVNMILAKGNPHFFCGARMLVKPYKEKSKLIDRNCRDFDPLMHQHIPQYSSMDTKFPSYPRGYRAWKYFQNELLEENKLLLEYQRIHLSKLRLARKNQGSLYHVVNSMDWIRPSEDRANIPSAECFNYLLDVVDSSGITGDDKINSSEAVYTNDSNRLCNFSSTMTAAKEYVFRRARSRLK